MYAKNGSPCVSAYGLLGGVRRAALARVGSEASDLPRNQGALVARRIWLRVPVVEAQRIAGCVPEDRLMADARVKGLGVEGHPSRHQAFTRCRTSATRRAIGMLLGAKVAPKASFCITPSVRLPAWNSSQARPRNPDEHRDFGAVTRSNSAPIGHWCPIQCPISRSQRAFREPPESPETRMNTGESRMTTAGIEPATPRFSDVPGCI